MIEHFDFWTGKGPISFTKDEDDNWKKKGGAMRRIDTVSSGFFCGHPQRDQPCQQKYRPPID